MKLKPGNTVRVVGSRGTANRERIPHSEEEIRVPELGL